MKKKFLYGVFAFVVTLLTVVVVHADTDAHTITTAARAMGSAPASSAKIYAIADDNAFDEYSKKIQFSAKSGSDKVTPKSGLGASKIIITTSPDMTAAGTLDASKTAAELAGSDWFTAYCLDGGLKLPQFSIYNLNAAGVSALLSAEYTLDSATQTALGLSTNKAAKADRQLGATTLIAVLNSRALRSLFANYTGYDQQIDITYALEGVTGDAEFSTVDLVIDNSTWGDPVSTDFLGKALTLMADLKGGSTINVLVKSVTLHKVGGEETISAAKLVEADSNGSGTDGYYRISYDLKDIVFDKYYADNSGAKNYRHSLWIIEHSYPSMTVDAFLAEVGSTKETLKSQIQTVYGSETFTDAEMENLIDNYVYWTVQYAMWKANDSFVDDSGNRLGNELYFGSLGTDNALNLLYQYLIKDRDEYTTYGNNDYTGKLTLNTSNNDKVTTNGDYYTYGPYTAKYDVIDPSDINVEVTSSNKADVSIVDKDGNTLTKVKNGQEFYVKCKKTAKVTSVEIKLDASGRTYDDNKKGTIYYANFVMNQNVITGLGYVDKNDSLTTTLTYNPKTGVPNVAIVFVITLIAFSLGYLALSYNNKSYELK